MRADAAPFPLGASPTTLLLLLLLPLLLWGKQHIRIRSLPFEFRHLDKLQMVSFKKNDFREIPTSFLFLK